MKEYLTVYSGAGELVRLKKTVQFIYEITQSNRIGLGDHVGFSCALAILKAEELRNCISPFCPAYESAESLVETLRQLYSGDRTVCQRAEEHLESIIDYFNLHQYSLVRRIDSNQEPIS